MIARKVKDLMDRGYKPWGIVIPNPMNAPEGSGVYQFKRGRDEASVVLTKAGRFVRGVEYPRKGKAKHL